MSSKVLEIDCSSYDDHNYLITLHGVPDDCPECHKGQEFPPPFFVRFGSSDVICFAFYQCLIKDCRTPFFAIYSRRDRKEYVLRGCDVPSYTEPIGEIPENIDQISPDYRKIYTQAHKAESEGLDLIAGCGYRKALEFLIKDYSILLTLNGKQLKEADPVQLEKINIIKKAPLMVVINEYLGIPKVTSMAKRATWLGNDETHYERRIANGEIAIMKSLMRLTILFIESEEEAKKLEQEIQPSV